MKENKYTRVTITQGDNEKLTRFCRANDISKKEFITLSLSYFEREGINPKSHESPKSEIEKVTFPPFTQKVLLAVLHTDFPANSIGFPSRTSINNLS